MYYMFAESKLKEIDVSNFNTSNATDMCGMFQEMTVTEIKGLENFDTSKVTNMSQMFYNNKATSLNLNSFDTSKVTSMYMMFNGSSATEIKGLEKFDTSNVKDFDYMFQGASVSTLDVSNFNTSKAVSMRYMFSSDKIYEIKGLDSFNTSKVDSMRGMFRNVRMTSLDLSSFDTSKVTNMNDMFSHTNLVTLDLSSFNTSKVTDMKEMFYWSTSLTTIYASEKFDVSNVTSSDYMFCMNMKLVGGNGTAYAGTAKTDKTYARIDTADSPGYFTLKSN